MHGLMKLKILHRFSKFVAEAFQMQKQPSINSHKKYQILAWYHGQWTCDDCFFKNNPKNWTIWADGPNDLWGICGISS